MKIPKRPPDIANIAADIQKKSKGPELFLELFELCKILVDSKYLHWDKIRFYDPPGNLELSHWWFGIKQKRRSLFREIQLLDSDHRPFCFLVFDHISQLLNEIDLGAGGIIEMPDPITNPETRDRYLVRSLMEEAITSSQLEQAATTRQVAKEMIRTGRRPKDRGEQMIVNNYRTMQQIVQLKKEPLSKELVFRIHRMITAETLDNSTEAGRFRQQSADIRVADNYNITYHIPPPAEQLDERMTLMCDFANGSSPDFFVHPVIRSIILHFWLAYDHPFTDGNGRTARALFYWSMLRHRYWIFEYISISQIILKAPIKYGRAFLYTETDDNDLTYFILYHLNVIQRAVKALHDYINMKIREMREIEASLRGVTLFNHRQRALVGHALRHPQQIYTIQSHQTSHGVVYETSRRDLMELHERGLLSKWKSGKTWLFMPTEDLEERL